MAEIYNGSTRDAGFRKFELRESNFVFWKSKVIDKSDLQSTLDLSIDNVNPKATQIDLLFEIVLKSGFSCSEIISEVKLAGKVVFSIANGALLICLEDKLTAELIDAVIELEPMQFICLDKGFQGNDQLKANTAQAFKTHSQNSDVETVFKVV
ncbi:hypothetical protein [Pseudidiomarina terrestris]|uniref:hypothetical protein n=1 Tax=Pseudidiomarina terrestris TaxID=2820060 RepID=UPI00265A9B38|nr:hypothetical protein [Pseudidiomarina sp. 1APR75-33.1]